jgi:cytochrome P450
MGKSDLMTKDSSLASGSIERGQPPNRWLDFVTYADCTEILKSASLSADVGGEIDNATFRGGTVVRLDPPAHSRRRKTLNRLLRRDGHQWFRDTALFPALKKNMTELLTRRDPDGLVRTDLIKFGATVNMQLAAVLIGLPAASEPPGSEEVVELVHEMAKVALTTKLELMSGLDPGSIESAAAAKDTFYERYYRPALAEHQDMLARVEAGDMLETELPKDLMTLVAAHADEAWSDPDLPVRDVWLMLRASVDTSTQALCHTLTELEKWFARHGEDRDRRTDPTFVLGAVNESLRLHPMSPTFLRRALEDTRLTSGAEIKAGDYAVVRPAPANRDAAVFGEDADCFDPMRVVPAGVSPYGLAFGHGSHKCYGLPLVLGHDGIDGSLVHFMRSLLDANARPDPAKPPNITYTEDAEHVVSYPIVLDGR